VRALNEEQARSAVVLAPLVAGEAAAGFDGALGHDAENALGGLSGSEVGDAFGSGGLGLVGDGRGDAGGSGGGEGTIGLGRLGTVGRGGAGGTGSGYARGIGGLRGRRSGEVICTIGAAAQVRGSLGSDVIRRVVRQHLGEVRYCYERALLRRPALSGRVGTSFVIGESGAVISSKVESSTLGDAPVEECIAAAVRRWEFPRPAGGGLVLVNYPFVVQPAGAE
jgi:hypothetical protein